MTQIVLNEDQARLLTISDEPFEVRDTQGTLLGFIHLSNEARLLAQAKKSLNSKEPGIPSHKVQNFLKALEEAESKGATKDELRALSKRLLDEARQ